MPMRGRLFFVTLLLLTLFPLNAFAWWNGDWQYRKNVTLDTTAGTGVDIKGNAAEVPVLIRLHTGNFGFFLDLKPDAGDLRFIAADDKTPLKYHIEKFDPINEMALIWVKVPALTGGANNNSFWMYYGNPVAPTGNDVAGTFDINQSLLLHFNEKDNIPKDVTAYGNNPTLSTVEYFSSSIIGSGAQFKGNSIIKASATPALEINPEKGWTFSSWIKITASQSEAYILHQNDTNSSFSIVIDGESVYVSGKSGTASFKTPKAARLAVGTWHNLAVVVGSGRISLFIDGLEQSSTPALFPSIAGSVVFGAQANGEHYFVGEMDEIGLSNIARSVDYIALLAKGQAPQSTLVKLGEDEKNDAGGEGESASYLGIILQNVTLDGWVVIVILVIMAIISWIVMILKGMVINRAQKDNSAFIESFKSKALTDLAALDQEVSDDEKVLSASPMAEAIFGQHDHFQSSPLYHIYHAGIQEVNSRLGRSVGAQASGLSRQAIESIRASLDTSLVRENQRLNKMMVLLTIAISGGPFLGLLGTVIGVMITFAAIAAAGDVNVNAIAPGIAAALVATVAGLIVAIPALFGYNYIGSRINEIGADMHVFVDEFITKVAEHYGQD